MGVDGGLYVVEREDGSVPRPCASGVDELGLVGLGGSGCDGIDNCGVCLAVVAVFVTDVVGVPESRSTAVLYAAREKMWPELSYGRFKKQDDCHKSGYGGFCNKEGRVSVERVDRASVGSECVDSALRCSYKPVVNFRGCENLQNGLRRRLVFATVD